MLPIRLRTIYIYFYLLYIGQFSKFTSYFPSLCWVRNIQIEYMTMFVYLVVGNSISLVDVGLRINLDINIGESQSFPNESKFAQACAVYLFFMEIVGFGTLCSSILCHSENTFG